MGGNPVAVVHDAAGLTPEQMLAFTRWMNLSESTFIVPTTRPEADYHVRIFTPATELPFAGHPTLGTCHAWLEAGNVPKTSSRVIQECGAGLVTLHRSEGRLAFEAPPLLKSGPVDVAELSYLARVLGLSTEDIVDASWTDNGPGWVTVLLSSAEAVLAVSPMGKADRQTDIGVVGLHPAGHSTAVEVRAFFTDDQLIMREDPVTGSLNAAAGAWLVQTGRLSPPYVAAQGTAMGRSGRIYVDRSPAGTLLVGGDTHTVFAGQMG